MKTIFKAFVIGIASVFVLTTPVAAVSYSSAITVSNTSAVSYTNLPVILTLNPATLIAQGYMAANGLDSNVTFNGSVIPSLQTDGKLIFVQPTVANAASYNPYLNLGQTPLTSMPIIVGYNGYVGVGDAAALEMGNNFSLEMNGYYNFSNPYYIMSKTDAILFNINPANTINASLFGTPTNIQQTTTAGGFVDAVYGNNWFCQTFLTGAAQTFLNYVKLSYDANTGGAGYGTTTIAIYATSAGQPTGSAIVSTTILDSAITPSAVNTFPINTITLLAPNTTYAVVIHSTATVGNVHTQLKYNNVNTYGGGERETSTDGGATWSATGSAEDFYFVVNASPYSSVSVAGQTTGLHDYKVELSGGTLAIKDGASTLGTTSFSGSVADNANIWSFMTYNTMPYANLIKLTVSATQVLWYQPNTIVNGTTLPDRSTGDGAQDGIITWGANPTDVTASIASLGAPSTGITNSVGGNLPNVATSVGTLTNTAAVASSPFYPMFLALQTASGGSVTVNFQAMVISTVLAVGGGILGGVVSKGRSFAVVMFGVALGAGGGFAMRFYQDVWILLAIGALSVASLLLDARKSW